MMEKKKKAGVTTKGNKLLVFKIPFVITLSVCTIFCTHYVLALVRSGVSFPKDDFSLIHIVILYAGSH